MERGTSRFMKLFHKKSSEKENSISRHESRKSRLVGGSLKTIVKLNSPPVSTKIRQTRSHDSLFSSVHNPNEGKTHLKSALSNVGDQKRYSKMTSARGNTTFSCCKMLHGQDRLVDHLKKVSEINLSCPTRIDNSLNIFIMEAKGVAISKRYYCEIILDSKHYGYTSSKSSSNLCFWGEHFQFQDLPSVDTICILLYREEDKKKLKSILIGEVHIHVNCVTSKSYNEKWYPLDLQNNKNSSKNNISIRIKCKFQKIEIFPMEIYSDFLQHIKENYATLCPVLEPVISVRSKEDIATCMVKILQKEGIAKKFLSDLLMQEFKKNDDSNLLLRGNSLASKAMEAFMKLVAEDYLHETLGQPIKNFIDSNIDCEVDPMRISQMSLIHHQQRNLLYSVKTIWSHIIKSHTCFPSELRKCFQLYVHNMSNSGKTHLTDKVISSSIFLRFLCPAILSPSLFNIIQEYPDEKTARNLTLVAKSLLTLSNFTKFQDKEQYMEFMNEFIEAEQENMKKFLEQISNPIAGNYNQIESSFDCNIDLGKQLSIMESLLNEALYNDSKLYKDLIKNRTILHLFNILQDLTHRKYQGNNNYIISEIASQNPLTLINSIGMDDSLEYITDIEDEARNINKLILDEKQIYEDVTGKELKDNGPMKRNQPFIKVHRPVNLEDQTSIPKVSLNAMQSSISPSKAYLTGSRKPADNLDTTDDYVLLSALGKEEALYQIPLGQCNSFSHIPSTPIHSRSISIMSGNANHHHHFQNHLSPYTGRRQSLNEYLQYYKYNSILKTLDEKRNMSNKDFFKTNDSHENSLTNQGHLSDSSFNELGTEIENLRHTHIGVSNNRMNRDKKIKNNMCAIPLSIQNTLYEFKPKNTNYLHNSIAPINIAHSVETLHISPKNEKCSNGTPSLKHPVLSNPRICNGITKNVPRTNPHCSPPNRIDLSVSRPKYPQSLSDIHHNQHQKKEVSSTKSIEKCQEEIQFLKTELDKMHQKLTSAEKRMFEVNTSITPNPLLGDQPLHRIYDRGQSHLHQKGKLFLQNI